MFWLVGDDKAGYTSYAGCHLGHLTCEAVPMTIEAAHNAKGTLMTECSTKSEQFKAGEQHVYAYQALHRWSTLRYAIRNLFR